MHILRLIGVCIVMFIITLWAFKVYDVFELNDNDYPTVREIVGGFGHNHPLDARFQRLNLDDLLGLGIVQPIEAPRVVFPAPREHRPATPHAAAATPLERVENHFARLEAHNDDPQNVHDHTILTCISSKYAQLSKLAWAADAGILTDLGIGEDVHLSQRIMKLALTDLAYDNIIEAARERSINGQDGLLLNLSKVRDFLAETKKGGTILIGNETIEETWIVTLIWRRIHHTANTANMTNMREAFFTQICNMAKISVDDSISWPCLTGRVTQIITTLTTLDADPILAEPEIDAKEIANAAYVLSYNIFQSELERQKMKDIYDADDDVLTKRDRKRLGKCLEGIKKKISVQIKRKYADLVSPEQLQEIIVNAQGGIE